MLKELKFVQGAVAKKDFVPALTHFYIGDGKIKGYNGRIALSCPIDLDLNVTPKAIPFVKAIQTCKTTTHIHTTPTGRLAVRSGNFKAYIECSDELYPEIEPEGDRILLEKSFLPALESIAPFIAEDASRPWARGILFRNYSAFATNNVILVEKWLGYDFPVEVNIPKDAVQELIRIGEDPTELQITDKSVTFHFTDNRWLRTQLFTTEWPDLQPILNKKSNQTSLPDNFFSALKELQPFANALQQVYFIDNHLSTSQTENTGALMELSNLPETGCFNIKHLLLLENIVESIDFSMYPEPCLFYGDRLRGAIVGMRT